MPAPHLMRGGFRFPLATNAQRLRGDHAQTKQGNHELPDLRWGEGGGCRRLLPHLCRGRPVLTNALTRLRGLALSVLLIAAFAVPALAGPFEDAVAKFANDDFSDTNEAVGAVAISGNPLAFPIISALQDGRLSADPDSKKVFITQADGKIIDAATGAAVDTL